MSSISSLLMILSLAAADGSTNGAANQLPTHLDLSTIRAITVQHNGRCMPLETLALDTVETVTGEKNYRGQDAVLWLLAWSFDSTAWQTEPMIPISNVELRTELELPKDREEFSYAELIAHQPLIKKMTERPAEDSKPDPLQKKVAGIERQLTTLRTAFRGEAVRPIPDSKDSQATWQAMRHEHDGQHGDAHGGEAGAVRATWDKLRSAFIADDADAFAAQSKALTDQLAALPAVYRPTAELIDLELHYNHFKPFRVAWMIMAFGALSALIVTLVNRGLGKALMLAAMVGGVGVLTYGLYLRGSISGRLPAANMFESLLFLSWGMGVFGIVSFVLMRDRTVPLTASFMGALALFMAETLPIDAFIRPPAAVLLSTYWMTIHVPVIMVSYSVLALAALVAHAQLVVMAAKPKEHKLIASIDRLHYWYLHVGCILLGVGIVTGSMWAASSWGRYWGWDPKEVWSLIAFLGYLSILHVCYDRKPLPGWLGFVGVAIIAVTLGIMGVDVLTPLSGPKILGLGCAGVAMLFFMGARGPFSTAAKSVLAFWLIVMTYLGVNFVLGTGLHSYGFGTGAVVKYMTRLGIADLLFVLICAGFYFMNRPSTGLDDEDDKAFTADPM